MNIVIVAGTRPNFIKIAPIIHEIRKSHPDISFQLVHTGQHYNETLNDVFFHELNIPKPDINLNCGSGTQAEQTAAILIGFEKYLNTNPSKLILVVGDVNSTLACSIVAKKMNRQLIHIEAGIRSFDLSMPEEINRLITDSITDHFFTTSVIANENLLKAGVDASKIHFVGNTMIDTLLSNKLNFKQPECFTELSLQHKKYWLLTLHRPSNVDDAHGLEKILSEINNSNEGLPIIFPVHPRTKNTLSKLSSQPNINFIDSLGYLEFMYLVNYAAGVITDSGGIQEETTVLQIPCLTLRKNTERPETVSLGTNELIPDLSLLKNNLKKIATGQWKKGTIPELWDGKTSERILNILVDIYI